MVASLFLLFGSVVGECVVAVREGLARHRTMPELNERRCIDKWCMARIGRKYDIFSRHVA
jgi:hypothetical protein